LEVRVENNDFTVIKASLVVVSGCGIIEIMDFFAYVAVTVLGACYGR
jgi:hypothetical protein